MSKRPRTGAGTANQPGREAAGGVAAAAIGREGRNERVYGARAPWESREGRSVARRGVDAMRCDADGARRCGELVMGSFSGGSCVVDRNAAKPRARSDGGTYLEAWTLNCLEEIVKYSTEGHTGPEMPRMPQAATAVNGEGG